MSFPSGAVLICVYDHHAQAKVQERVEIKAPKLFKYQFKVAALVLVAFKRCFSG